MSDLALALNANLPQDWFLSAIILRPDGAWEVTAWNHSDNAVMAHSDTIESAKLAACELIASEDYWRPTIAPSAAPAMPIPSGLAALLRRAPAPKINRRGM
jgi:hypothetical protein